MKLSPWWLGSIFLLLLLGLAVALTGLLQLGWHRPDPEASSPASVNLAQIKKRGEDISKAAQMNKGTNRVVAGRVDSHRTFVSRTLVFLSDAGQAEPVQPLQPSMITDDGIQVGWKQKYDFDPADPAVRDLDSDGDGFTNLEEFQTQTDPRDRESSPAKESKLRSRSGNPVPMAVTFTAKSGGTYTIRFQVDSRRGEIKAVPGREFWLLYESARIEILEDGKRAEEAARLTRDRGGSGHLIPLRFVSYEERIEKIRDALAGGIEVEVDNSSVVLERNDALKQKETIFLSTPQKLRPLSWDVGDIRFFAPIEGGREIGPYRVGQAFEYEGKRFIIRGREGVKIELVGSDGKSFWVPADATKPSPDTQQGG